MTNPTADFLYDHADRVIVTGNVLTRHPHFKQFLWEEGYIREDVRVVHRAKGDEVTDMHVIGTLPLWLALRAATVTEIPIILPPDFLEPAGGLTVEMLRNLAQPPVTYGVNQLRLTPTGY